MTLTTATCPHLRPVLSRDIPHHVRWSPLPLTGLAKTGPIRTRFLLEAVADLRDTLRARGTELYLYSGPSDAIFRDLCKSHSVSEVFAFAEPCSEEADIAARVQAVVETGGGSMRTLHGFELYHHDDIAKAIRLTDPRSFKTYSAFRRKPPPEVAPGHDQLPSVQDLCGQDTPCTDSRAPVAWRGGETAALAWLQDYVWGRKALARSYVGATNTMAEGKCLSPRRVYHEVRDYKASHASSAKPCDWIVHELVWRDYVRFATLAWGNQIFKRDGIGGALRGITWRRPGKEHQALFEKWRDGLTGYPFVDCFMREVAATGYASHCGRECACWFLVRDLGLDWRAGAEYYEHVLIDYEPTANWGNWAYRIASTYPPSPPIDGETTRTTEMLLWAQMHDSRGLHIRAWLPELAGLPASLALEPWRLLAVGGVDSNGACLLPLDPPEPAMWSCPTCALTNHPNAVECSACSDTCPPRWGEFIYGQTYPLPCVRPKIVGRPPDEIASSDLLADAIAAQAPSKPLEIPMAVQKAAVADEMKLSARKMKTPSTANTGLPVHGHEDVQ
eukprot:gene3235-621_t